MTCGYLNPEESPNCKMHLSSISNGNSHISLYMARDTENLTLSVAMRAGYLLIALCRSMRLLRMCAEYTAVKSGGNEAM